MFLAFFALQEALRSVFRNFLGMRWFRWLFPGIGIVMLGCGSSAHFPASPAQPLVCLPQPLSAWKLRSDSCNLAYLPCLSSWSGCFTCAGGSMPQASFLAMASARPGSLVAFLLRSEFGTKFDPVVRIAPPIAYIIGVAIWLATFLKAEPERPEAAWAAKLTPEQMITELKRHTKTVKGILGR